MSIATRLLLAFGAVALLSLIAAVVGLQGFQRIAATQSSVVDQAVPVLRQAHSLTELNTQIGSLARRFIRVTNNEDRQRINLQLEQKLQGFKPLLDKIRAQGFARQIPDEIENTIAAISEVLSRQNDSIKIRNLELGRLEEMSSRLVAVTSELDELSDSLVANAAATTTAVASSLYDLVQENTTRTELFRVFDRLVEVDIDAMERMYELRSRSANLTATISRASKETDQEELQRLERQAVEIVEILGRRIKEINDPQRQARAQELLQFVQLQSGPIYIHNIFKSRHTLLDITDSIEALDIEYRELAAQLNDIVAQLSDSGSGLMHSATLDAKSSLNQSRRNFIGFAVVSVLIMALILWWYVHHRVIKRLTGLKDATLSIAGGQFDHPINATGEDEVSQMAQALQLFRDDAVEKQRLDEELRTHKENLEKTVLERTSQLEQANKELANEVALHDIAREKAEQANRAKTDFLATISHELRTPLSGALGSLRLLRATSTTPKQNEYIKAIDTANTVLLKILDNVLGYSQARAGKLEVNNENFSIRQLLDNLVGLMTASAEERANTLRLHIDDRVPDALTGDAGKLNQILLNLLGNAIKFTEGGHIDLSVEVVDASGNDYKLEFQVQDTGIGVSAEKREEMFKAFTQADTSISRRYGGIGLGLSICKRLTSILGGQIDLTSNPGQGTSIFFTLPFGVGFPEKLVPEKRIQAVRLPSKSVLLVEDDETNRTVAKQYLGLMNHSVVIAEDGEQALEALNNQNLDLVLLDVSLPGMDGLAVVKAIRDSELIPTKNIPVIAMSAHVFKEEIDHYLDSGMDGFLGKPFSLEDLERTITDVLAGGNKVVSLKQHIDEPAIMVDARVIKEDVESLGADKVLELVSIFKRNSEQALNEIKSGMEKNDVETVKKIAHRLRSAAGNFGCHMLCNLLKEMESTDQTPHELQHHYAQLSVQLSNSLGALDEATSSLT